MLIMILCRRGQQRILINYTECFDCTDTNIEDIFGVL